MTKVRGARQDSQIPSAPQIRDGHGAESVFRGSWRREEMVSTACDTDFHAFEMIYDSADYSCSVDAELCDVDAY